MVTANEIHAASTKRHSLAILVRTFSFLTTLEPNQNTNTWTRKNIFSFLTSHRRELFAPEASSRAARSSARQGGTMRNPERYLASRFGIHTSAPFSERHTPYGCKWSEMDEQSVTPLTPSSSITYLTLALVSLTTLVVLLAFGFSPKAAASSITKHGTLQRASITSLARAEKRTRPLRPCDCHVPNAQGVLEHRILVPVPAPRPGPRPVIPHPNPPAMG
jgi:hypothetical protein